MHFCDYLIFEKKCHTFKKISFQLIIKINWNCRIVGKGKKRKKCNEAICNAEIKLNRKFRKYNSRDENASSYTGSVIFGNITSF